MATTTRALCRSFAQISRATPAKRKCIAVAPPSSRPQSRMISSSIQRRAEAVKSSTQARAPAIRSPFIDEEDAKTNEPLPYIDPSDYKTPSEPITVDDLEPTERAEYETLSQQKQEEYLGLQNHYIALFQEQDYDGDYVDGQADMMAKELDREAPLDFPPPGKLLPSQVGWWAEDEDDELGYYEDADDGKDDSAMMAIAEDQLQLHREVREYTRIAAWDMPLLTKYAKPFDLPGTNQVLRFRYTTYMGESHPAEKKTVIQFATKDLAKAAGLSEAQRIKLIKLAGVRYNPDTDTVKMSSEKYEFAAQNKRYLGDLVAKLVKEAQNEEDMFEDVPLDFRHHKQKKKHVFPEEWKLTGKRVEELQALRMVEQQPALEAPKNQSEEGARRVAEYVMAQPLGRRDPELRR